MPATNQLLLSVEEAAQALGIGRSLCYRLIADGSIRSIKVGKLRKVPVVALAQYVQNRLDQFED